MCAGFTPATNPRTAKQINAYVVQQRAFLDPHLKIDDVVDHCELGRTYVSMTFQRRFGSFAKYVNSHRLDYYDQYMADNADFIEAYGDDQYIAEHPEETKESAALASGFANYMAYYRAKQRQDRY